MQSPAVGPADAWGARGGEPAPLGGGGGAVEADAGGASTFQPQLVVAPRAIDRVSSGESLEPGGSSCGPQQAPPAASGLPLFIQTNAQIPNLCASCGSTTTPGCWRRGWAVDDGGTGFVNLCNKCGLRYKAGRLGPNGPVAPARHGAVADFAAPRLMLRAHSDAAALAAAAAHAHVPAAAAAVLQLLGSLAGADLPEPLLAQAAAAGAGGGSTPAAAAVPLPRSGSSGDDGGDGSLEAPRKRRNKRRAASATAADEAADASSEKGELADALLQLLAGGGGPAPERLMGGGAAQAPIHPPCGAWSHAEVAAWLEGQGCVEAAPLFAQQGLDGCALGALARLARGGCCSVVQALAEAGVQQLGTRLRIADALMQQF